jgi:hypothetical protein
MMRSSTSTEPGRTQESIRPMQDVEQHVHSLSRISGRCPAPSGCSPKSSSTGDSGLDRLRSQRSGCRAEDAMSEAGVQAQAASGEDDLRVSLAVLSQLASGRRSSATYPGLRVRVQANTGADGARADHAGEEPAPFRAGQGRSQHETRSSSASGSWVRSTPSTTHRGRALHHRRRRGVGRPGCTACAEDSAADLRRVLVAMNVYAHDAPPPTSTPR